MKAILMLILVFFMILTIKTANAQTAEFYQQKIDHFKTQQIVGMVLGASSIPVGTLGIIWIGQGNRLLNDSDENADVWGNFFTGSFKLVAGIVVTAVGVGLLAGGVTMALISDSKIDKYQEKLNGLNVGIICTPEQKGLMLTYRF